MIIDTCFAKVAHHPDGRDCLYIEGILIPFAIEDTQQNNEIVHRIASGLRGHNEEAACSGNILASNQEAADAQVGSAGL